MVGTAVSRPQPPVRYDECGEPQQGQARRRRDVDGLMAAGEESGSRASDDQRPPRTAWCAARRAAFARPAARVVDVIAACPAADTSRDQQHAPAQRTAPITSASTAGNRDRGSGWPRRIARSHRAQWSTARSATAAPSSSSATAIASRTCGQRSGGTKAATASPPPIRARPVRIQARKVRSLASENR